MKAIGVQIDTRTVLVAGFVVVARRSALASSQPRGLRGRRQRIVDFGADSNWPFAFYAVFLVGLVLGGRARRAGPGPTRRSPTARSRRSAR